MIKWYWLLFFLTVSSLGATERRLIFYYAKSSTEPLSQPLTMTDVPLDVPTDFVYAFVTVDRLGNLFISPAEKEKLVELSQWKKQTQLLGHQVRIFFSVGGKEGSLPLAELGSHQKGRATFSTQVRQLCEQYQFDGVDIDWQYLENPQQAEHFYWLIRTVHEELKPNNLFLTISAPSLSVHYKKIDWQQIAPLVDRISVMGYDSQQHTCAFNTKEMLKFFLQYVPKEKLAVGVPRCFTAMPVSMREFRPLLQESRFTDCQHLVWYLKKNGSKQVKENHRQNRTSRYSDHPRNHNVSNGV